MSLHFTTFPRNSVMSTFPARMYSTTRWRSYTPLSAGVSIVTPSPAKNENGLTEISMM